MLVLRPVELTDLPQLQQLARDSLVGVTSLPDNTERLRQQNCRFLRLIRKRR